MLQLWMGKQDWAVCTDGLQKKRRGVLKFILGILQNTHARTHAHTHTHTTLMCHLIILTSHTRWSACLRVCVCVGSANSLTNPPATAHTHTHTHKHTDRQHTDTHSRPRCTNTWHRAIGKKCCLLSQISPQVFATRKRFHQEFVRTRKLGILKFFGMGYIWIETSVFISAYLSFCSFKFCCLFQITSLFNQVKTLFRERKRELRPNVLILN